MKSYISKNYRHINTAGDKAKTDIEAILSSAGYRNIGLKQSRHTNSVTAYFATLASILKGMASIRKGDIVVLQYPLKKYYDAVVSRAVSRGAHVITLIHDLGSFRRKKLTVEEEVARLNRSSAVIVHTVEMRDWLSAHGVRVPMVVLELFDYLSAYPVQKEHDAPAGRPGLMFAGNCSRNGNKWLYELAAAAPGVNLILYGNGVESDAPENIKAMGCVDSDALVGEAKGDYGLVWYGSSLDEIDGVLGDYLKYNASHKASMYLRAGLPVIIWDKAALAGVIRKLGAGVCVSSLRNIDKVLAEITPEEYARMRANAIAVAEKLSRGGFVADAVAEAEKYC